MASGIPVADAIQAGAGVVQTAIGLLNQSKTAREARRLAATRPQYEVDPLTNQDLSLAQNELSNSSSAAERAYSSLDNGQFSSAIGSTLRAGGNPNSIGAIYGNSMDGRLRLSQMSDQIRLSRINNYINASRAKQDADQTKWQVNEFAPWEDAAQANAAAREGASQQVNQGINTFGAGVANAGQSVRENNQFSIPNYNNKSYNNNSYATGVPMGNSAPAMSNSTNYLNPVTNFPVYNF